VNYDYCGIKWQRAEKHQNAKKAVRDHADYKPNTSIWKTQMLVIFNTSLAFMFMKNIKIELDDRN
jgi:hypothetical protein